MVASSMPRRRVMMLHLGIHAAFGPPRCHLTRYPRRCATSMRASVLINQILTSLFTLGLLVGATIRRVRYGIVPFLDQAIIVIM